MIAQAITGSAVIALLYFVSPRGAHVPDYGEISEAIARASTEDPLFPEREDGAWITATILTSIAWHESNFFRAAVGDNGKSFGLYQIQPGTSKTSVNSLTNPIDASFIAIDLIRTSFQKCEGRHWTERLSWYVASNGCPKRPVVIQKSAQRMIFAEKLFTKFPPPSNSLPLPYHGQP